MGITGISKSRVSELWEQLDEEVPRYRIRPLGGSYAYLWIDATYLKARQDGRVASVAVVIAVGVKGETGEREVLGLDVGPSEDGAFWSAFLRSSVLRPTSSTRTCAGTSNGPNGQLQVTHSGSSTPSSHRGLTAVLIASDPRSRSRS